MTNSRDNRLTSGERQVAPTVEGIRADHVARYRLAAGYVHAGSLALDLGCGCGYGSSLLAAHGAQVLGVDISAEAVAYATAHYGGAHRVFLAGDLDGIGLRGVNVPGLRLITALEVLEHVERDADLLQWCYELLTPGGALIVSAPNRDIYPNHQANLFHRRHYTPAEFAALLTAAGFTIERKCSQHDQQTPEIVDGWTGGTLIAVCRKGD